MIDLTFIFTVTLYNKYIDRSGGKTVTMWKRTVIRNCYFGTETVKQISGNVVTHANNFVCRIPADERYTDNYQGEADRFTLTPGDIIIKGEHADEITDVQGERTTDILQRYAGNCFTVKSVSDNTIFSFAPHYRASGV